jgi:hypothetical protein
MIKNVAVHVSNSGAGSDPMKLVDGENNTGDDRHMWVGSIPAPPQCIELVFTWPVEEALAGIRVWNYNRSLIDSVKGVKEVEVTLNDRTIWSGTVARGNGRASVKNATSIKVDPEFVFEELADPEAPKPTATEA